MKIAFVASYYDEVEKIKEQLKEKNITNIDVFNYGSEPEGYDIIEYDVRPNKTHGEILDLGQCLSYHGFPEDPYFPPEKSIRDEDNKELLEKAISHLRLENLEVTLPDDDSMEVTREFYDMKIKEVMSNKTKLTKLTERELTDKMELEQDPTVLIAILAVLFDKIHGQEMQDNYGRPARGYKAKNGKDVVNFVNGNSITWMSELWAEKLPQQDSYHRQKYLKAFRTRAKNMLKEKASIWGIRFLIDWLIEQDVINMEPEPAEEENTESSSYSIEYEGIEDDEIPF